MSNLQMSDITLKSVNIESGNFSVLESKDELITTAVINLIASDSRLHKYCKSVFVESPYYDREYLSTYYTFFSRKFRSYPKECCRLLFFSKEVTNSDDVANNAEDILSEVDNQSFLGFATIIPTSGKTQISRVVVRATPVDENDPIGGYNVIKYKTKVHCLGHEFYVEGFESLKQVGPCVCGHAAFWGIAAHHSQWRSYSAMLAGDIDKILREDISNGFAMGVTANQLSQLICKSGSTPIMRSAKRYDDKKGLLCEICSYLDSRIPVLLLFDDALHVVVAVGNDEFSVVLNHIPRKDKQALYESRKNDVADEKDTAAVDAVTKKLLANKIQDIIIIDDNNFSFTKLEFSGNESEQGKQDKNILTLSGITGFIVPMYPRVNLQYRHIVEIIAELLYGKKSDDNKNGCAFFEAEERQKWIAHLSVSSECDIRIFLTSSNSYKEYLLHEEKQSVPMKWDESIGRELRRMRFRNMPKMIWCVEFSNPHTSKVMGNIIFDTTASPDEGLKQVVVCSFGKYGAKSADQLDKCKNVVSQDIRIGRFRYIE